MKKERSVKYLSREDIMNAARDDKQKNRYTEKR